MAYTGDYYNPADMYLAVNPDVMTWAQDIVRGRGIAPGTSEFRDAMRNVGSQHYGDNGKSEGRAWQQPAFATLDNTPDSPTQLGVVNGGDFVPNTSVDVGASTWTYGPGNLKYTPGTYDIGTASAYNQDPDASPLQEFQNGINSASDPDPVTTTTSSALTAAGTGTGNTYSSADRASGNGGTAQMLAGMVGGNTPDPKSAFGKSGRLVK